MSEIFCEEVKRRRWWQAWGVWIFAAVLLATVVGSLMYASQGTPDPTEARDRVSRGRRREQRDHRLSRGARGRLDPGGRDGADARCSEGPSQARGGAATAFAAAVGTWCVAQAVLAQFARYGDRLQAVTGLLAIAVLLVVMNWFFHKVYWTKWIGRRNAQRKRVLARRAAGGFFAAQLLGLLALGFTSVYREGFEVVLFLQSLELKAGTATVLEGVGIGLAGTVAVGIAAFFLQRKLPYKRMLVATGILLGVVLVVMVGGSARTLQDVGWLSRTPLGVQFPDWWARWFEVVPTWETIGLQSFAAVLVVGSYFAAEYLRVRQPRRRGEEPAVRASEPALLQSQ
jgi:high-affinity iron transporter